MSRPISIGVASDTREFSKGITTGVIKPLEDAARSLDDVQRKGDQAGDDLEGAFEKAQNEVSAFKREQAEAAKKMSRDWKNASDDVARDVKSGTREASEGVDTLKQNTASNAKEIAASFDGSAEGLADGIQGLIAEIAEGFGPAGLLGGVLAAGIIGIIISSIGQGQEETEEWRAKVGELTAEFIETGGVAEASVEGIVDRLKELASATEGVRLQDLADTARRSKGDFRELAEAYAGQVDGIDELIRKQETMKAALEDEATTLDQTSDAGNRRYGVIQDQITGIDQYVTYLGQAKTANEEAATAEANYLASGGPEMEAKAALVSTIDEAYDGAAAAVDDYKNKESGLFDVQAYIDAMNARAQALADYQTSILSSGLTPEAIAFLNEQGVESAAQMLAGYQTAAPAQKADLNRIWTEAGKENSGSYKQALDEALPKTVAGPKIVAEADLMGVRSQLNTFVNQNRTVRITADLVTRSGQRID